MRILTILLLSIAVDSCWGQRGYEFKGRPGQCPLFIDADLKNYHCQKKTQCYSDFACNDNEKCCENPCGISRCMEAEFQTVELFRKEKCPVLPADYETPQSLIEKKCEQKRTDFCYRDDCKRCCYHSNTCNPSPILLISKDDCRKEVCRSTICSQQGTECVVQDGTNSPICACKLRCPSNGTYVCGNDGMTYKNKCQLDKEACHLGMRLEHLYDGICKPSEDEAGQSIEVPKAVPRRVKVSPGGSAIFICESIYRGAHLQWYQKLKHGVEISMPEPLVYFKKAVAEGGIKRYAFLEFSNLRRGNVGEFICKQTYRDMVAETVVKVSLKYEGKEDNTCRLPFDKGPCYSLSERFYFDVSTSTCQPFLYGGCQGNDNNFDLKTSCEEHCKESHKPDGGGDAHSLMATIECGNNTCRYYSKCVTGVSGANKICICPTACEFEDNPVCGSDFVTYPSRCALEVRSCQWQRMITAVNVGKCKNTDEKDLLADPLTIDPCSKAICPPYAQCIINPLNNKPTCVCPKYCEFETQLICGSDHQTYLNECVMRVLSCRKRLFIRAVKTGRC